MFSWTDLSTTDPSAAEKFYAALFGWNKRWSFARPMNDHQKQVGAPPHWTCCFGVDDVDRATADVLAAGGKVIAPPFDVGAGRVSAIDDPLGAGAVLWQSKDHAGVADATRAWCELLTRDESASRAFWTRVMGWRAESHGTYTFFESAHERACGMTAMPKYVPPHVPSHWRPYFSVESCEATVKKTTELGGRVIAPPQEHAVGRSATLMDPLGAVFAILEPRR